MLEIDTRERLIQEAKVIFAECGYEGATVKAIADRAGVNISLISYHFLGKEGLYKTCLEQLGNNRLRTAQRILVPSQSLDEVEVRLKLFVEEMFNFYLEEPNLVKIVTQECNLNVPIAADVFQKTFLKIMDTVVRFLQSAQDNGFLSNALDTDITAKVFFGSILQTIQRDSINKIFFGKTIQDPNYRNRMVLHVVSIFMNGCLNKKLQSENRSLGKK